MRVISKTRPMLCQSALGRSGGIARSGTKIHVESDVNIEGDFISHQGQNHRTMRLNLAVSFQTLRGGSFRNNTTTQIVISNSGVSQRNPQIITTTTKSGNSFLCYLFSQPFHWGKRAKLYDSGYLIGSALTLANISLSGQAYFELR